MVIYHLWRDYFLRKAFGVVTCVVNRAIALNVVIMYFHECFVKCTPSLLSNEVIDNCPLRRRKSRINKNSFMILSLLYSGTEEDEEEEIVTDKTEYDPPVTICSVRPRVRLQILIFHNVTFKYYDLFLALIIRDCLDRELHILQSSQSFLFTEFDYFSQY